MKKVVLTLATMLMLAVSSVCSATPGKVLDTEIGMVEKLFAAKDYKAVEASFTQEFKNDFNAASFDNFKKNFGNSTDSKLLRLNKFDDGDVLEYAVAFEKAPNVMYAFIFQVNNEKPLIAGMQFRVIDEQAEQAANAGK